MIDRLTAMSWLEGLAQDDWRECHSDSEVQEIARQTLAMLKEQEPIHVEICGEIFNTVFGDCPRCEERLNSKVYPHWCGFCGQAVTWE